jgi:hypothetical protein
MERRQIRLVPQQPALGFSPDDQRWLQTQNLSLHEALPRKSYWYRSNGISSVRLIGRQVLS